VRVKCKECNRFVSGVCGIFRRKRPSGKKRWCDYFSQKVVTRKAIPIRQETYKTRQQKKLEIKREIENRQMLHSLETSLEQRRIAEIPVETPISAEIKKEQVKVKLKKESIFGKLKNKLWRSHC